MKNVSLSLLIPRFFFFLLWTVYIVYTTHRANATLRAERRESVICAAEKGGGRERVKRADNYNNCDNLSGGYTLL